MTGKFITCLIANYTHVENAASYAVKRNGDKLTLFFEKSNGVLDWVNNFNFPAQPYRNMEDRWYCHRGFLKVWKSIEPYVKSEISDLTVSKIEIIGYSHGGAIAQLCYEYVKYHRPDVEVTGYGFGSPRVLWGKPSENVRKRFDGFKIIRNGKDLVTHLPPTFLGFHDICQIVNVGKSKGLIKDHREIDYLRSLYNLSPLDERSIEE